MISINSRRPLCIRTEIPSVKFLNQLHDKEKAEILLKTTIEKSLRLMNVYTPVVLQLHFSIPSENDLDELKQLDAAIRRRIETSQSELSFDIGINSGKKDTEKCPRWEESVRTI